MKLFRCISVIVALAGALVFLTAPPAAAAPAITSFTPPESGNTGATVMTVEGSGFVSGAAVALVESAPPPLETAYEIAASSVVVQSPSKLVATFAAAERPGTYKVRVSNPDNTTGTSEGTFTLRGDDPEITGVSPASAERGTTPTLTVTGANLSRDAEWELSDTDGNPLTSNITVSTITIDSPTQARLTVSIPTGAGANPPGPYDLTVTNADGKAATCDPSPCFSTKNPPAAAVAPKPESVEPAAATNAPANTAVEITVEGEDFDSSPQATRVTLVMGGFTIPLASTQVTQGDGLLTPDSITGTLNLAGTAPGSYDVVLHNDDDGGEGVLADAFTVAATGAPVITSFQKVTTTSEGSTLGAPATTVTLPAGESATYAVNGDHFATGDAITTSATGLTAANVQKVSKTQLRVTLQAAPTLNSRDADLVVTHTDSQFASCSGCVHIDGRDLRWYLSNRNSSPVTSKQLTFGVEGDIALLCDWDGNGTDTPGLRRGTGWILSNKLDGTGPYVTFSWAGLTTDVPVCGDWNGDGKDTVGVRRGETWFLKNSNTTGPSNIRFSYGTASDRALVGDWNGDGKDTIGVRRGNVWYLRNANSAGLTNIKFTWGRSSDTPLVGDWNGDRIDTVAVRRGATFYLKAVNDGSAAHIAASYGLASDRPIAGDYDGNRTSTVGVVRVI